MEMQSHRLNNTWGPHPLLQDHRQCAYRCAGTPLVRAGLGREGSADEVDHDEVEDHVGEDEVREAPLGTDGRELGLVLGVHLQAGGQGRVQGQTSLPDRLVYV